MPTRKFTAAIWPEGGAFVALCPELDIASQGDTLADAKANLIEAVGLFLGASSPREISDRLRRETYVGELEVKVG